MPKHARRLGKQEHCLRLSSKLFFPSTQVGRTDFLAGLNSIGVNREGMGEHCETLLFLTGFSDLSNSNLIDVSVLVQIIEENYDFSVLNLHT